MPANCTSLLQPLDQGIIRSFKSCYQKRVVQIVIAAIESGEKINNIKIDVKQAVDLIISCWRHVTTSTIFNCFIHAGFIKGDVEVMNEPEDNLIDTWNHYLTIQDQNNSITLEEFITIDESVNTSAILTNDEIILISQENSEEKEIDFNNDEKKVENLEVTVPKKLEALKSIDKVKLFLQSDLSDHKFFLIELDKIESFIFAKYETKQSK